MRCTLKWIFIVAAVIALGGMTLLVKGVVGSEGFLTGDATAAGPGPGEPARIARDRKVEELNAALTEYAATVPGFSVAVLDRTGELYTFGGDVRYRTASVVKVQVLACLLLTAQDDGRELTAAEDTLAKRMIRQSDNDATIALFARLGKQPAIQRCDERLGLRHTVVDRAWGLTRTTVTDQVRLLDQLVAGDSPLSAGSRAYAHTLMSTVSAEQRWGVPAVARAGEDVTVKNGWLYRPGTSDLWIVNSVGRITGDDVDVSIAVLSHGHRSRAAGEAVIEKAVTTTRSHLEY